MTLSTIVRSVPELVTRPARGGRFRQLRSISERRREWIIVLGVSYLLSVAVRLALTWGRIGPTVIPDEPDYLLNARVLTGGLPYDSSGFTFYQGGYSLLVAPAYWISSDPTTIYRIALAENAVVNSLTVLLLYLLLRRVMGAGRWVSLLVAIAGATLPGIMFFEQLAMSDAILGTIVLGWLLSVHAWLSRGRTSFAVLAGLLAALAYMSHARGLIVLAIQVAILALASLRNWAPLRQVVAGGAALVACALAARLINNHLFALGWPSGQLDRGGLMRHDLTTWSGLKRTAGLAFGMFWALLLATWGLGTVAVAAAVRGALRSGARLADRIFRGSVVILLIVTAVLAAGGSPDEHKIGNLVQNRYLSFLHPVLFALGIVVLARLRARRRALVLLGAAASWVAVAAVVRESAGDRLLTYDFLPFNFPEASWLARDYTAFHFPEVTLIGLVVLLGLGAVTFLADGAGSAHSGGAGSGGAGSGGPGQAVAGRGFGRRERSAALCALLVVLADIQGTVEITRHISRPRQEAWYPGGKTLLEAAGVQAPDTVAVSTNGYRWQAAMFSFEVPWKPLKFFNPASSAPPAGTDAVLTATPDGDSLQRFGWHMVARNGMGWQVWRPGIAGPH